MLGDYPGAVEDISAFVEWARQSDRYEEILPKREAWIIELETGSNPFDQDTLEELLNE